MLGHDRRPVAAGVRALAKRARAVATCSRYSSVSSGPRPFDGSPDCRSHASESKKKKPWRKGRAQVLAADADILVPSGIRVACIAVTPNLTWAERRRKIVG